MKQIFSANYQQARQRFLNAARLVDARCESYENPCEGIGGAGLFTDVATLGSAKAPYALVLISGTHGVEGFAGSAIQTGLLSDDMLSGLNDNIHIVMVHALNPYGFAFLRRANEDNIDLNRNFVDHTLSYPENSEYARLATVVSPKSISKFVNTWSKLKVALYGILRSPEALQKAVTQGQYTHPQGLFYGGNKPSWSNVTLHKIIQKYLLQSKKVFVVDIHTGLGPYGDGELILSEPSESPQFQSAQNIWGKARVKSTIEGQSVSAHLFGTMKSAFSGALPEAEISAVGLEFGTFPLMEVFNALRDENWLFHHGAENHPRANSIKEDFLRKFYPDDDAWKQRVWEQGAMVVKQALDSFGP
jgi:hypothetical protein